MIPIMKWTAEITPMTRYICEAMAVSDDTRDCGIDWWVRSPGKRQHDAVYIGLRSPNLMGNTVNYRLGVRPAIRVRYSDQPADDNKTEDNKTEG